MPYRLNSVQETFSPVAGSYFYFDCKNCLASAHNCTPLLSPDGMYCPGTKEVAKFDRIQRFVDANSALNDFCYIEEKEPEPSPMHPIIAEAILNELMAKAARNIIGCVVCDSALKCRPEVTAEGWRCPEDDQMVTQTAAVARIELLGADVLTRLVEPPYSGNRQ